MSTTGATERLARLLNLVPYFLARPGIEVVEAATDLGISEQQLRDDLELLWVCGLPGYGPGDLIDMAFDGDHVTVMYDAGIDRPLRLTPDEALALIVALRMLAEMPGAAGRDAIETALAKIETAAGDLSDAPVAVRMAGGETGADRLAAIRTIVERRHALRITYYTATRDQTTDRVVDPMRLLVVDGRTYLEAWCRQAEAVRMFRLDRIDAFTELDEPAVLPRQARHSDLSDGVFRPSPEQPLVTLRVSRWGRWITEYYPCESVEHGESVGPGGADAWVVTLRVSDLAWARRLVLGLGSDVEVVAPAELAEAVRDEAVKALAAYGVAA